MSDWFLAKEGGWYVIRRGHDNKRHPKKNYTHFKTKEELDAYVVRINGRDAERERALANAEIYRSFIRPEFIEEFRETVFAGRQEKDAPYIFGTLFLQYGLNFFTRTRELKDPLQWKDAQLSWGAALKFETDLIFDRKMSPTTIKETIQIVNRFMRFLHAKLPNEYPLTKLEPIPKSAFLLYAGQWRIDRGEIGRFISVAEWDDAVTKAPRWLRPYLILQCAYGLRRSESASITVADVRASGIRVERQAHPSRKGKVGPTKSRHERTIPHWFLSGDGPLDIVSELPEQVLRPTPDEIGKACAKLGFGCHDLRRTFITTALRYYASLDVMRAAGHVSLSTTMLYVMKEDELRDIA